LRYAEADAGSRAGNDCCFPLQAHSKLAASLVLPGLLYWGHVTASPTAVRTVRLRFVRLKDKRKVY
jgi:hypothetical protein